MPDSQSLQQLHNSNHNRPGTISTASSLASS
jgi:hypothetical protein